jgi:hypothetical protein
MKIPFRGLMTLDFTFFAPPLRDKDIIKLIICKANSCELTFFLTLCSESLQRVERRDIESWWNLLVFVDIGLVMPFSYISKT